MTFIENTKARSIEVIDVHEKENNFNVTVVIILHGEPLDIERVINCIKQQEYEDGDIEILILDDYTSPKSRRILYGLDVNIYDMPHKCTISEAKNKGIDLSKGKYVFYLDDHIYLKQDSIQSAMNCFKKHPQIAGVCGFYTSLKKEDYNTLRDIKRHSIYKKNNHERFITLENFSTFSTGIAVINKELYNSKSFDPELFPNDFGGEDIPSFLLALNNGLEFYYTPLMKGYHEHNLDLKEFIYKMEIEIRGRFSIYYWYIKNQEVKIPYLHGFLNFPYFFTISSILSLLLIPFISFKFLLIAPLFFLSIEGLFSLKCFFTPIKYKLKHKFLSFLYIFFSDILSIICLLQYLLSNNKRPFPRLNLKEFFILNKLFFRWELQKFKIKRK